MSSPSARGCRAVVGALGLALLLAVPSCASTGPAVDVREPEPGTPILLERPDGEGQRWVEETLASLSLEEAVGQLVFPWISGAYAADDDPELLEALEWVERWGIGGVAISIGTPHAYVAKLNTLQSRAGVPLLVTSDFEQGGPGMRINHSYALPTLLPQGGGVSFPPTMALGAIGDEAEAFELARATAREARAVGVHMTFAPVVDVNSNPANPIINTRAFGESPAEVGRLAGAYIRGARAGGVLTTAKHFPGHGDTRIDSHLDLPEITADRDRLDRVELVPFRAAVAEGVDAVMTAHVSVPAVLGPGEIPATFAPEFMTGILREEMGFDGLLFTDALRMGAITERYGAGEAAVRSLEAGADVILVPASVPASIAAVVRAVEEGRLTRERIDRSVRRILETKARVGLHSEPLVPLEGVTRVVGSAAHREAADRIAARSITLARDRDRLVPLDPSEVGRVLSITYAPEDDLVAGREFDSVLSALVDHVETGRIRPNDSEEAFTALIDRAAAGFDVVLVNAFVAPRAGAGSVSLPTRVGDFIRSLAQREPVVLTSFGNPYLLETAPEVGTYVLAWGDREVSQRAAARAIAGATAIEGRLPITLPGLHARGHGIDREAIPAVAAREERRGDALDEAGLLRAAPDEGDPEIDIDGGDGAGGPGADAGVLRGLPAPDVWRHLPVSPLEVDPRRVGMDPVALEALDAYIMRALADSVAPGAALAVGRRGQLVRLRGYGRMDWAEESPSVTPFTIYDQASLTKVVATTTAVKVLVQEGTLRLEDRVVEHLPDFARGDARKANVTVEDLLLHRSGLPAYRQFFREHEGAAAVREAVYDLGLDAPPGARTVYSDIGFKVLAWVVEAVSGEPFERFVEARVFAPLGMDDTGFNPDEVDRYRIAPTERDGDWRPYHIHGEVHDENGFAMGGVAGHAGLFSTAQDLAVFASAVAAGGTMGPCQHRAGRGTPCGRRSLRAEAHVLDGALLEGFVRRRGPESSRALGWDTPSGRSSAGDYFSSSAFGHTGFTGTSIWIDPELDLFVVLLTNRVNPSHQNSRHIAFRRAVHDAVATAVRDRPVERRSR